MHDPSPEVNAALYAIQGGTDLSNAMLAMHDTYLARSVALAPRTDPLVRAVAALCGGLPALIDTSTITNPELHDAVARYIGHPAGGRILVSWAQIAPAAWGRAHTAALINAVTNNICSATAAAALIGPCDESAALLKVQHRAFAIRSRRQSSHDPPDVWMDEFSSMEQEQLRGIAQTIRHWGQLTPDNPTAWMDALSPVERERLLHEVQRDSAIASFCLPWLPPDIAWRMNIDNRVIDVALSAFAEASPTARKLHAELLHQLVVQAQRRHPLIVSLRGRRPFLLRLDVREQPAHLGALTRLACAMNDEDIWTYIQTAIREYPDKAESVVFAAPWDDLPDSVRTTILESAAQSDTCAVIAAAQGYKDDVDANVPNAAIFFAALDSKVWNALDVHVKREWLRLVRCEDTLLGIRSIGPSPEVLSHAYLNNDLVHAVRRHGHESTALQESLLPVSLRALPIAVAHNLIVAMSTMPSDPGAFFAAATFYADPDVIDPARTSLSTITHLANAVALQRSAEITEDLFDRCTNLQRALRGQPWDVLNPIMPLFDNTVRAIFTRDLDTLSKRLARPGRQEEMRQALTRVTSLPLEVAIPTCFALICRVNWKDIPAAKAIAHVLRDYGDVYLTIAEAPWDDRWLRDALLWLPEDDALADALRALTRDDPPCGRRLAYALCEPAWDDVLVALLAAPLHHVVAVWRSLNANARRAIIGFPEEHAIDLDDEEEDVAYDDEEDDDQRAANVVKQRNLAIAALSNRPDVVREIWRTLPDDVQQSLKAYPSIAVAVFDILDSSTSTSDRRGCMFRRGKR